MLTVRKEDEKPEPPYYAGNVQLMEARFLELSSSIRALYKSNQDLEEALQESPGDADFIEAILENQGIIVRKRKELFTIVQGMQELGANVEVPDDIQTMDVTMGNTVPLAAATATAESQGPNPLPPSSSRGGDEDGGNSTPSGEDQGVYL